MKIERTVDAFGRTTDTITTTDEENAVLDVAMETIIQKYLAAGNAKSTVNREFTEWTLLGLLRDKWIEGVQSFVENYQAVPPKGPAVHGYV